MREPEPADPVDEVLDEAPTTLAEAIPALRRDLEHAQIAVDLAAAEHRRLTAQRPAAAGLALNAVDPFAPADRELARLDLRAAEARRDHVRHVLAGLELAQAVETLPDARAALEAALRAAGRHPLLGASLVDRDAWRAPLVTDPDDAAPELAVPRSARLLEVPAALRDLGRELGRMTDAARLLAEGEERRHAALAKQAAEAERGFRARRRKVAEARDAAIARVRGDHEREAAQ